MKKKYKAVLSVTLGAVMLLGSNSLHANAVWQGTGFTTSTNDLDTNTNWSNGIGPTSATIAEFDSPGATTPGDLFTNDGFSALGIQFDASAPAYYLNNESSSGNINIGLSGVVNNSAVTQTIGTDTNVSSIIFAGGSSGQNMNYPLFNGNTAPGGVTFLTGTNGNGSFDISNQAINYAIITNVSGDSSIGSLNAGNLAVNSQVVLTAGSLTTGSLNTVDTFYGVISGAGSLVYAPTTSAGTFSLGNANTYTGGTVVNAVGTGGLYLLAGGSLASTGTVAVNSGTFSLAAITAPQTIGDLSGTGVSGVVALGPVNGLTVNQATNKIYAGTFTGAAGSSFTLGTLASPTATGTLQLTGDSSAFAGSVNVNSGNLQVNGNLGASAITVNSGATLSGLGTFGTLGNTTTIAAGGILSPGNSVGVITNAGNQVFAAGSNYLLEENGYTTGPITPSIDLLVVNGTTVVNAASINQNTTDGLINFNTNQTFLTSAGGLTVNDGGFTVNNAALFPLFNPEAFTSVATFDANNYYLENQTTFTTEAANNGGDNNSIAVGAELDSIVDPSTSLNFLLNDLAKLSTDDLIDVLDDISGAQYASEIFQAEVSNRQFIRRMYDPLRQIVTTEPSCDCCEIDTCCSFFGLDVWAEAGGGQRQLNHRSGHKLNEWDVTLGAQKTFNQDWTVGIAGSYEHHTLNHHSNGNGKGHTWFGGLYGLYRPANYYVLADIAYGYTQHDKHRHVTFGDFTDSFHGRPQISQVTFYAEGGFDYNMCSFLIQPFVGIEVAGFHRNRFTESFDTTGEFALNFHKKDHTTATSSLGVHLTDKFNADFNVSIDLAWLYRFTNNHDFGANFESFGTGFTGHGVDYGRSSGEGAITFSKDFQNNWRVYVEASGEVWSKASAYNVLGGVQFTW